MIPTSDDSPTLADVRSARVRIADLVRRTPVERSAVLSGKVGADVHLKLECWQPTRSFKVRGATNFVTSLSAAQLAPGLVTASAGNHGLAVALAARAAGTSLTVFLPSSAPRVKRERIRQLGARIEDGFATYDDAETGAMAFAEAQHAVFVHAFADPRVIAGQATVALEVLEDVPDVRSIIVPVGGGGLISGIGRVMKAVAPAVRVIGVQSTMTRAMHAAFAAGRVVDVPVPPTLADGLAGRTDDATFQRARSVVDEMVLVEESDIAEAIRTLFAHDVVTAEGSGAVGVAALLSGRVRPTGTAVVVVTGGNIDATVLAPLLAASTAS
jgi:threonine dehydratase